MYTMQKTPRSSFMRQGMGAAPDQSPPVMAPTVTMAPIVAMPPTPAPSPVSAITSLPLGKYVLWGGLAYLAYWLLFSSKPQE
jgi:hypothetical protein